LKKEIDVAELLIVDDEPSYRKILKLLFEAEGHSVRTAENGKDALQQMEELPCDLIVSDVRMPDMDGIELLAAARETFPEICVVLMTAFGTIDTAREAFRLGADDFIQKPFQNDELRLIVQRALERQSLLRENRDLKKLKRKNEASRILGKSESIRKLLSLIEVVAKEPSTVLITGESGTGKELVAQSIHQFSGRSENPFVAINCGAIPENLIEAELFGYMKGAFTGATSNSKGLFEAAQGGTIFLDEIGELPLHMQVKLLRVLQEKRIRPLGSTKEITVDARVIAATNRDLLKMIDEGTFRQDLYYRLAVIPMRIPSLTERREDIATLAINFVERFSSETGKTISLCKEGIAILESRDWPGNVRELENLMERAVALTASGEVIDTELLREAGARTWSSSTSEIGEGFNLPEHLNGIEKSLVTDALERSGGNQTKAAALLGIPVHSIRHLIGKHNL
jgi:two-component system response regulator PilR (NtrC family)